MRKYKDLDGVEKDMREKTIRDVIEVGGVIFTQDYYDLHGREITYGNKKHNKAFEVITEDRYKKGWGDAEVNWIDEPIFRTDLDYRE